LAALDYVHLADRVDVGLGHPAGRSNGLRRRLFDRHLGADVGLRVLLELARAGFGAEEVRGAVVFAASGLLAFRELHLAYGIDVGSRK